MEIFKMRHPNSSFGKHYFTSLLMTLMYFLKSGLTRERAARSVGKGDIQ